MDERVVKYYDCLISVCATKSSMSPLRKVESNHSIIKSSIKYVLKTYNTTDIQRYTVA